MKTTSILFIFFLTFFSTNLFAEHPKANFGKYGIQKYSTLAEYQKYVGEIVTYLPTEPLSYEDKKDFKGKFNQEYVITKITGNDKQMTFILQENGGKSNFKMIIANGDYDYFIPFCITDYYTVPLFLIDKFNKDKVNLIGLKFTNDKVKSVYEVIDVLVLTVKSDRIFDKPYPTVNYVLKNLMTEEKQTLPAEGAEKNVFKKDLKGKYVSNLVKIEKPADSKIRYGKTKLVESEGVKKYSYIDDYIDILIFGTQDDFSFMLKNISQNSIKLIWNESVFVDFDGKSSKVMHEGIKYSQKNEDQPSSIIIKDAILSEVVVPTSNVRYSDVLKKWVTDSMYPRENGLNPGELKLMLPIQVKDVVNEYLFVFKVEWLYDHPEIIK
ncbi:hypothetical protein [Epilithonimonas tenax]|uniref:hypothetical protein n=1 Tax=Epilithonimonas tenax TaxID=191577 RepID=UPI0003F9751E|nr:hypothetical protein [Epilithonimonas tenax]